MGALNEPLLQADAPLPREASTVVAWGLGSEVLLITSPYRSLTEEKEEEAASVPSTLSAVMVSICQFVCFMLLVVRLALPGCHSLINSPVEVLRAIFVLDGACMALSSVLLLISLLTMTPGRQDSPPAATDVEGAHPTKHLLEGDSDAGHVAVADGSKVSGLLCLLPRQVVVLLCVLDCLLAMGVTADLFLTFSAITRAQHSVGFGGLGPSSDHFP